MYSQSHAVGLHWTQEYDQEEGLYTKINSYYAYCIVMFNVTK